MTAFYAIGGGNWTDATLNGGNGLWNDAADGSGSWGSPATDDDKDINGNAVNWQNDVDGVSFTSNGHIRDSHGGGLLTFGFVSAPGAPFSFGGSVILEASLSLAFATGGQSYALGTSGLWTFACAANWNNASLTITSGGIYLLVNQTNNPSVTQSGGTVLLSPSVTVPPSGFAVVVPDAAQVENGINYGPVSQPVIAGSLTLPAAGNVTVDNGAFGVGGTGTTPTYVEPALNKVQAGYPFGAGGTELTGTLAAGTLPLPLGPLSARRAYRL